MIEGSGGPKIYAFESGSATLPIILAYVTGTCLTPREDLRLYLDGYFKLL
jgi:hypothetical protein